MCFIRSLTFNSVSFLNLGILKLVDFEYIGALNSSEIYFLFDYKEYKPENKLTQTFIHTYDNKHFDKSKEYKLELISIAQAFIYLLL